jgi:hypothetical protein
VNYSEYYSMCLSLPMGVAEVVFFVPRNKLFRLVCPCVILPESTRIYGENTGKTYKKEKLMNEICI